MHQHLLRFEKNEQYHYKLAPHTPGDKWMHYAANFSLNTQVVHFRASGLRGGAVCRWSSFNTWEFTADRSRVWGRVALNNTKCRLYINNIQVYTSLCHSGQYLVRARGLAQSVILTVLEKSPISMCLLFCTFFRVARVPGIGQRDNKSNNDLHVSIAKSRFLWLYSLRQ